MKKTKLSRYLLFITGATLFTIIFMIIQKSYSNLIAPLNQTNSNLLIKPIDPHLDTDTLLEIGKKIEYQPSDIIFSTPISSDSASSSEASPSPVL
jgi:hypothetical protein